MTQKKDKQKKLTHMAKIKSWVIKYLCENGATKYSKLCKLYADENPDVSYDTIRVGVWKAGKISEIQRDEKRRFIYVSASPAEGKPDVVHIS